MKNIKICATCVYCDFQATKCKKRNSITGWNDICIMWKKDKEKKSMLVERAVYNTYKGGEKC